MVDGNAAQLATLPASADEIIERAGPELAKSVFRTANCLLASHSDAEEVTLEVLIALDAQTQALGKDELEAWLEDLPAWLDETTISKSKSRAKKRRRHAKRLDELALLADTLDDELSASERRARLVKEVLSYLPRRHRFVHVLAAGLGHDSQSVAQRLGTDTSTVTRSRTAVTNRLQDFAQHTLEQRELLTAMTKAGTDNPMHDYVRVFGVLDDATRTRLLRRLFATMAQTTSMELSGDSMFDAQMSGFHYPRPAAAESLIAARQAVAPPPDPAIDSVDPGALGQRQRHWPVVAFGSATLVLLIVSLMTTVQLRNELAELGKQLDTKQSGEAEDATQAKLLEPGKWFDELAYDGRVQPSKDGKVELLRSDAKGAEFRLLAGSLGVHVNTKPGVEWIVHDGRYDIRSEGKRFGVTHTGAVPEVEVLEGKVRVSGGLLGPEGVEVRSSDRTLAAVMAASETPLNELPVDDKTPAAELELDELFARALSLRETEPKEAEDLFRDIEIRGGADWISERAFEQLRTLVGPEDRTELAESYLTRFPDGSFREAFTAMRCQSLELEDEVTSCWEAFTDAYPSSLYGP